jgi:hypothetical protein
VGGAAKVGNASKRVRGNMAGLLGKKWVEVELVVQQSGDVMSNVVRRPFCRAVLIEIDLAVNDGQRSQDGQLDKALQAAFAKDAGRLEKRA